MKLLDLILQLCVSQKKIKVKLKLLTRQNKVLNKYPKTFFVIKNCKNNIKCTCICSRHLFNNISRILCIYLRNCLIFSVHNWILFHAYEYFTYASFFCKIHVFLYSCMLNSLYVERTIKSHVFLWMFLYNELFSKKCMSFWILIMK